MAAAAPAIGQFGQQNQRAVLSEDGEQLLLAMRSLLRALQGGHQVPSVCSLDDSARCNGTFPHRCSSSQALPSRLIVCLLS